MSDKYITSFCKDCITVLQKHDAEIRENLLGSDHASFYKYDNKGIGLYSITEPILKFLIFADLCQKYQIWPEGTFYRGRNLLDIAMYSKKVENIDERKAPDIAIEMKWADFTKSGMFFKWAMTNCIDDIYKIHKECDIENKYIMQFVRCDEAINWHPHILRDQLLGEIDKRKIKGKQIEFVYSESFDTCGATVENKEKFYILIWKIV